MSDGSSRSAAGAVSVVPQGNLAERIRAAGAGIGAFFCPKLRAVFRHTRLPRASARTCRRKGTTHDRRPRLRVEDVGVGLPWKEQMILRT
jgi:hypothetical protein